MKRVFDIYDHENEPILSFENYDFTPEIGTICMFDLESEIGGLDIIATVEKYIYIHWENRLSIVCKIDHVLEDYEIERIRAYNQENK